MRYWVLSTEIRDIFTGGYTRTTEVFCCTKEKIDEYIENNYTQLILSFENLDCVKIEDNIEIMDL